MMVLGSISRSTFTGVWLMSMQDRSRDSSRVRPAKGVRVSRGLESSTDVKWGLRLKSRITKDVRKAKGSIFPNELSLRSSWVSMLEPISCGTVLIAFPLKFKIDKDAGALNSSILPKEL